MVPTPRLLEVARAMRTQDEEETVRHGAKPVVLFVGAASLLLAVSGIGAGRMGGPNGRYLLAAGTPVTVYDPSGEARRALVELGAVEASGPAEVAGLVAQVGDAVG